MQKNLISQSFLATLRSGREDISSIIPPYILYIISKAISLKGVFTGVITVKIISLSGSKDTINFQLNKQNI